MNPTHRRPLKPLVIGPARGGYGLAIQILASLNPTLPTAHGPMHLLPEKGGLKEAVLRVLVERIGHYVAHRLEQVFARHDDPKKLIINGNFARFDGGPKWLGDAPHDHVVFRKYVGALDQGDFTLLVKTPRAVMDLSDVVHSHLHPEIWAAHPAYADHVKFHTVRNPVGILNSACFSLNALTSEYIQRCYPPEREHDDAIRVGLGLYKLTDLTFFQGLIDFQKKAWDDFMPVRDAFHIVRWEDILDKPRETIVEMARHCRLEIPDAFADEIWKRTGYTNLAGMHHHNYRAAGSRVGGWKAWLVNEHLEMIRDAGFGPYLEAFGYTAFEWLDPAAYTPFQKRVADAIAAGKVLDEVEDRVLFDFAFNKSNINAENFDFRSYPWRDNTRVERSCFKDEALEREMWDAAEDAAATVNAAIGAVLVGDYFHPDTAAESLRTLRAEFTGRFDGIFNTRFGFAVKECETLAKQYFAPAQLLYDPERQAIGFAHA
jgi:hypothetical protein